MAKKANLKVLKNEAKSRNSKLKSFEFTNVSDLIPFEVSHAGLPT